jgi:predicted O-methyltransferase YrrM
MTLLSDPLKNQISQTVNALEGWCSPERGCEMAELILKESPQCLVEIGVFGGRSLIAQALALQHNGKSGVIYGIDPWRVEPTLEGENEANRQWWSKNVDLEAIHRQCMNAVWQLNLGMNAVIIRSTSQEAAGLFPDDSIDVLNIDGNHSELASTRDVKVWLPKVKPGGFIWADDMDWPSTQAAKQLILGECDLLADKTNYCLFKKKG